MSENSEHKEIRKALADQGKVLIEINASCKYTNLQVASTNKQLEETTRKMEVHLADSILVRADVVQNNCARIKYYAELEDAHKNTEFREGFWKHASVFYVSVIGGVVSLFAWGIKKIIGG